MLYAQVMPEPRGVNSPFITYDDASITEPGVLSIGFYTLLARPSTGESIAGPGIGFSLGLNPRTELSGFTAVISSKGDTGRFTNTIDDSIIGLKVLLWKEADHRPAVALKPAIELPGDPNGGRAHLALPVILEKDTRFGDLAYSAGYITRGVAFSSLQCTWDSDHRVTPMAVIAGSRVVQRVSDLRRLGLNPTQLLGSAGVNLKLGPRWNLSLQGGSLFNLNSPGSHSFEFGASITYTNRVWGHSASSNPNAGTTVQH
jgi:hypothetical protein